MTATLHPTTLTTPTGRKVRDEVLESGMRHAAEENDARLAATLAPG